MINIYKIITNIHIKQKMIEYNNKYKDFAQEKILNRE